MSVRLKSPYEMAADIYSIEPCARSFLEDLSVHLTNGFVFSTPTCFFMGRPVRRDGDVCDVVNPRVSFVNPDCFHVYLAAGRLEEILEFTKGELRWEWFSWERNNKLRFYRKERFLKLCQYLMRQFA